MKIWLKYLIAAVIGVVAGLVIPVGNGAAMAAVADVAINIGRYMLVPLVFFSVAIAAFELNEERRLSPIWLRTIAYSVGSVVVFSFIGLAGAFILSPGRIPLAADATSTVETLPGFTAILAEALPPNALDTVLSSGFLLPAVLLATILGLAFSFDKSATKPVVTLFDSMSRICWQINSFIVEILPLPLILVAGARASSIARTPRIGLFGPLLLTIGVESVLAIFVILPLVLFAMDRKKNPYKTIFALAAPAIASAITGNTYAQAGAAAKHLKESLGVRRRAGAVSLPLALAFGRAGSALVTATAFVAILNSYSNLGLGISAVLWMIVAVPATSLILGAVPGAGPIVALTALCAGYGRGFESGYILIAPAALALAMIAACLDAVTTACVVAVVASKEGYIQSKDIRHFI